jgi:hypothetical protein
MFSFLKKLFVNSVSVVFLCLAGCQGHAWRDAWHPIQVSKGLAWHNEAFQQTAFDTDANGRIDRLRFWIGSGMAEELIDDDLDGWFDSHLVIVYGKDGERKKIHKEAPVVPVTNAAGAFDRPRGL